jgi:hypothetical protein
LVPEEKGRSTEISLTAGMCCIVAAAKKKIKSNKIGLKGKDSSENFMLTMSHLSFC